MSKLKNNLRYLKDLINSNKDMEVLLEHLFYQKATACIWHSYDSQACETYCNHVNVSKEIRQLEVCPDCPYYEVLKEAEG